MSIEDDYLEKRMSEHGLIKKLWAACELDWFDAGLVSEVESVPGSDGMKEFDCPFCDDLHQSIEIWARK
jgi:hypothetical protein